MSTTTFIVSILMVRSSQGVVNLQNKLYRVSAVSQDEAHGKAIPLAQADFPEHAFHTACAWALTAPAPSAAERATAPEGWVLVPRATTAQMREAFKRAYKDGDFWGERIDRALDEMLRAAPPAPQPTEAETMINGLTKAETCAKASVAGLQPEAPVAEPVGTVWCGTHAGLPVVEVNWVGDNPPHGTKLYTTTPCADGPLKDHEIREVVNAVTKVAQEYEHTQQLRARIKDVLFPVLKRVPSAAEDAKDGIVKSLLHCVDGWKASASDEESSGHHRVADAMRICAADLSRVIALNRSPSESASPTAFHLKKLADDFADAKAERWCGRGRGALNPTLWERERDALHLAIDAAMAKEHADG